MGLLKRSPVYERHFQEVLRGGNNSYELYLEELYLQQHKQPANEANKPSNRSQKPKHNGNHS